MHKLGYPVFVMYCKLLLLYKEDYKFDGSYFYDVLISRSNERNSCHCAEKLPGTGDGLAATGFSAYLE